MKEVKTKEISDVIKRRRIKLLIRSDYINLALRIIFLIIIGYLIFDNVFLVTQARGTGMFPAVQDGDLIIAYRLHKGYQKSDVVAYEQDGETKIGRIAARDGDVVTIEKDGTLRVNGTVQSGEILFPTYPKDSISYPYKVDENHIFILGDYRTQAIDSRDLGAISMDKIKGKLITLLRRQGI